MRQTPTLKVCQVTVFAIIGLFGARANAQNATDDAEAFGNGAGEGEVEDRTVFNPRLAVAKLAVYQDEHPEFAAEIATWIISGTVILIIGWIMFLHSEIQAVLVVRDQDFRRAMIKQGYMEQGNRASELVEYEAKVMAPRPLISLFAGALMFVALALIFFPLCDILSVLGLPSAPCILIVTFGSFFTAICIASFWMFVVWSCTRTWAALVFLTISLTGQVLLPTGNPLLLVLWMLLVFGGGFGYFYWAPELYRGKERPVWLQDVGDLVVPSNFQTMVNSLRDKYEVETNQMERMAQELAGGDKKTDEDKST